MSVYALAQRTITGTVTDSNGEALFGATVLVEGTGTGTVTDLDGNYSLDIPRDAVNLVISYTGFITQTVAIGASNVIDVILEQDVVGLDVVVVVGYTPQRKKDLTGAVSSVNTADVEDIPLPTFEAALQGTAAGVVVNKASGKPGSGVDVNIRGRTSILASNQPLYVVDGVPIISGDNFNFQSEDIGGSGVSVIADLNPDDIASIEVLKDASTAAIYGSRAANGVVLITTKKGQAGKTKFTINSSFGNSWLPKQIPIVSGPEYQDYSVELWGPLLDQFGLERSWQNVQDFLIGPVGEANVNWQDEVFRTAPVWEHSATMSGGSDRTRFFASAGYSDQQGIIESTGFNRISTRLNLDHSASDRLSFGMNLGYTRSNTDQVQNDNNIYGVLGASLLVPPVVPIMNEDGSWGTAFGLENAVAAVTDYDNNIIRGRMQGNVFGKWNITDALSFKSSFGVDIIDSREEIYEPSTLQSSNTGRAVVAGIKNERFINENVLTYNKTFGLNNLQLLGGISFQEDKIVNTYTEVVDFPTDDFRGLSSGATPVSAFGGFTGDNIQSYFTNLNYNYGGKYYLTATFRADGSSRFINNKFGYFPGVSAGWNISEESFLAGGPFDLLKLRVGWGQTGNNTFGNFLARALYGGGRNYRDAPGIAPSQIGNADLRWETTTQTNIGLDFAVLNNRLSASVDFYVKNTDDLLLNRPIPTTSGFTSVTENVGKVRNTGVDFSLTSSNVNSRNFTWTTTFILGYLKNEVLELVNGTPIDVGFSTRIAEGQPLGSFFGHQTDGIFQNQGEIDAHATQPSAAPGDIRFMDISGGAGEDGILGTADDLPPDGVINDNDRTFIGKALPDFQGGLRNTLSFAGFDVNIFFQFAAGFQIYNNNLAFTEGMNSVFAPTKNAWDNRWQQEGDDTDIPRLVRNDPNNNRRDSDRFVEDGDYLRLKTLTIGYTLPASLIDRAGFSRVRFYVSGYNLLTWTGYSGFDPEVNTFDGSNTALGTDFLTFPQPRSIAFGINVGF
jgi:TonB-linked SusC/RagA family outer membrane protein